MKKILASVLAVLVLIAAGVVWYLWPDLDGYPDVRPYGTVPAELRAMVRDNLLHWVTVQDDVLVRQELTKTGRTVTKYDFHGNVLSVFEFPFESVEAQFEHQSGALIHLVGDQYMVILDDNNVVGRTGNGNDLSFLLHDSDGKLLWEYNLPGNDKYHTFLYQTLSVANGYYLWLKESGIDNTYEVIRLDANGQEVFVRELDLTAFVGEKASNNLLGYLSFSNGVITGYLTDYDAVDRLVTLDMELNLISISASERPIAPIGTIDGEPIRYGLTDNGFVGEGILADYPYGTPEMVLDYGDFYLVLSWKHTGINHDYHGSPIIGSMPMKTQHIYAAYDKSDELMWIGTVDSTRNS